MNLKPKRKGIFRLFNNKSDNVSLTLNFESTESLFSEVIEMQTANLDPGRYTLSIKAVESSTNETLEREIDIVVSESQGDITSN